MDDSWFIADAHQDVAWACLQDGRAFADAVPGKALTLPNWQAGRVKLACTTVFAADQGDASAARAHAAAQCDFYDALRADHPDAIRRPTCKRDLDELGGEGPTWMVHLMEGADPIHGVDDVAHWRARGVVAIGPVWNTSNRFGDGITSARGLTDEGCALVRHCGSEGLAIDLSHLNPTAFDQAIDAATGPVYASHSNAAAICGHRRNLSDAQLECVAAAGGVVGVVFYAPFVQARADRAVPIDGLVRHIDHIGHVIGLDRICLGTDLDGGFDHTQGVAGIPTAAELPTLGEALRERRYTEEHIRGILGENLRRFIRGLLPE